MSEIDAPSLETQPFPTTDLDLFLLQTFVLVFGPPLQPTSPENPAHRVHAPCFGEWGSWPQDMQPEDWLSTVRAGCATWQRTPSGGPSASHHHVHSLPWHLSGIWATYAKLYFSPHLLTEGCVPWAGSASRPPLSLVCKSHLCGHKNDPKTAYVTVA